MNSIKFQFLDDLFLFLNSCERGEGLGKSGRRSLFEHICVAKNHYAIGYQAKDWDGQGNTYGGAITENEPPIGRKIHLNDLLRAILLTDFPTQSLYLPSLVLAIPCASAVTSSETRRRLYDAWREVPKSEGAESRFFFKTDAQQRVACHAVEITNVDPAFRYEPFRTRHPEPLKMFVPAWEENNCFLYVEWGYMYPKATDFYYLYDETRDTAGSHIVLCTAGPIVPISQTLNGRANRVWRKPGWHLVGSDSYHVVEEVYQCEIEETFPVIILDKWAQDAERLPLNLSIGEASQAVGSMSELEKRIGQHERELEQLHARRERLQHFVEHEFLPVYVWHQKNEAGGQMLPAGLDQFLRKPLGELNRYSYTRVAVEGGWDHYVKGEMRVPSGSVLAVPCDRVYLCEARWEDWQLPLYVRSDCALNLAINEAGLAAKVWELLGAYNIPSDARIILAEPRPAPPGEIPAAAGEIQFSVLTPRCLLDEAMTFTNQEGHGPSAVAQLGGNLLHEAVSSHNVTVAGALSALDEKLLDRARELLAHTEISWDQLRAKLQTLLLEARIADVAVQVTDKYYSEAPETWVNFVNEVFDADKRIAEMKLQGLRQWREADGKRQSQLEQIAQTQINVAREIESQKSKYEALIPARRTTNEEIARKLADLEAARSKVAAEQTVLKEQRDRVQKENAELDANLRKLNQEISALREALKKLEKQRADLRSRRDEIDTLNTELNEKGALCQGEGAANETALEQLRTNVAKASSIVELHKLRTVKPPRPKSTWARFWNRFRS